MASTRDRLAAELGVEEVLEPDLGRRWNVAPGGRLYAVVGSRSRGECEHPARRRMGTMAWGLVPSWVSDPVGAHHPINARVESLLDRPHFAGALAGRRCLVPVDGFYEWGSGPGGTRRPFFLAPPDGSVLAIAAVWDRWCPAAGTDGQIVSCALLTTAANDDVAPVHDRMPVVVDPPDRDRWLDPANHDEQALLQLVRSAPPGRLQARPVSPLVNSTANDGPELLADAAPDPPSLFPA